MTFPLRRFTSRAMPLVVVLTLSLAIPFGLGATGRVEARADSGTDHFDTREHTLAESRGTSPSEPTVRGNLRVFWSQISRTPSSILSANGFLSDPSPDAPVYVVRRFIRERGDLYGFGEDDIATLVHVDSFTNSESRATTVVFGQVVDGMPVVGASLKATVDFHGRLGWISGEIFSGMSRIARSSTFRLSAEEGAVSAAAAIGRTAMARSVGSRAKSAFEVDLGDEFDGPALVTAALFPLGPGRGKVAWSTILQDRASARTHAVTIDGATGAMLARDSLTSSFGQPADYRFRVFTEDSPQPNTPVTSQTPVDVERETVGLTAEQLAASPRGWVGDGGTTAGNNVTAQTDTGIRATSDASLVFGPALGFPIDRRAQNTAASIVNLFYWTNFAHDYLYARGFDESSHNFQQQSFTGQGIGGDPVVAIAQHGPGRNQSSFTAGSDGKPGLLHMYMWDGGYDGDFDQTVILHEYCHGLTSRLILGSNLVVVNQGLQTIGMYEGWSDWFALSMLANAEDDVDAPHVVGGYVSQNWTRGVRHFPYSTDLTLNPITFSDVDFRQSDVFPAYSEHSLGEVWCSILWEVRASFIRAYGFEVGRERVERLVVEALKLTHDSASFVDARNAMLAADVTLNEGSDQILLWRAFAKRGVGLSAFSFGGRSVFVREAFDVPAWCESSGTPGFDRVSYDETATHVVVSVRDADLTLASAPSLTIATASGDEEVVDLEAAATTPGLFTLAVPIERGAAAVDDGVLQTTNGDTITARYVDSSPAGTQVMATARAVGRVVLLDDNGESGPSKWKSTGWAITDETAAGPGHCWTDSVRRFATLNTTTRLQVARPLDLRGCVGTRLSFSHAFATEVGYDHCYVEVRSKRRPWEVVALFTGKQREFVPGEVDLSRFDGEEKVRVRFAFKSDRIVPSDGWYVDDIRIVTGR